MATLRGESVDRPAVCFYEIDGFTQNPDDSDPFNIYSDPSWRRLLDLATDYSDRIVLRGVATKSVDPDPLEGIAELKTYERDGSRYFERTISVGEKTLRSSTRRDRGVNTTWHTEHLLKSVEDVETFLSLPRSKSKWGLEGVDRSTVLEAEAALGESGVVAIDTADPLCLAASLFDLGTYTVIAMTETTLFRRLLDHFASPLLEKTEAVAEALPGRLWRIYGPEYASEPYLPPNLFREYVESYVTPMISAIQRFGGYARIHCHGRLKNILPSIAAMNPDGLDPIEPPPQGDIALAEVAELYGERMVLFGNIEASDIENLSTREFESRVSRALEEGMSDSGRGFVLMPSSCPYGRKLSSLAIKNYETMLRLVGAG